MTSNNSSLLTQQFREHSLEYLHGKMHAKVFLARLIVHLNEVCGTLPDNVYSSPEAMALARAVKDLGIISEAVESREAGNYRLDIVPIRKEMYTQIPHEAERPKDDVTVMQDAFAIRSTFLKPSGFYFYAYADQGIASEVVSRMLEGGFDEVSHRVNFTAEQNPLVVVHQLRERR